MSIQYTADQLKRKFPGPPGSPGFSRLADVLRVEGRLEEAIQLCQEGLRTRPGVSGYVVLGKALMDSGRAEEAREQFEAALRLDPRCLSAMHFLARIMNKMQWADAAASYYRSILEVEPWDAEIRALLGEIAPAGSAAIPPSPYAQAFAPAQQPAEADTFEKPDGMAGDVLEVNLNDVAADFLPAGNDATGVGVSEESLEDALSSLPLDGPTLRAARPPQTPSPFSVPAPENALAEPRPQDLLKTEPPGVENGEGAGPSPISGQDVEDRLDSLFGNDEIPSTSPTATWTAAPALPADGSATAAGDLQASETGVMAARTLPDEIPFDLDAVPDLPGAGQPPAARSPDFSAVDFAASAEDSAPEDVAAFADASGRVQGEDIERRLDELFNLSEEEPRPAAAAPIPASGFPVAPGPKVDEAVSLGEAVPFGEASTGETPVAAEEIVTGQDVADKLDNLFGIETAEPPAAEAPEAAPAAREAAAPSFPEPKPWSVDAEPPPPPPAGELMSTESMLPPGWFGDAGDGPRVTGADVEAQLDKLFNLEGEGEAVKAVSPPSGHEGGQGNAENTVTFLEPEAPSAEASAPPAEDADQTMLMPAMKDPQAPAVPRSPQDADGLKESVADWLARQDEDPKARTEPMGQAALAEPDAGDTMILPSEGEVDETFGTLAPEEIGTLSETASIEMVDGSDVAERLDELFANEGTAAANAPEMSLFVQDDGMAVGMPAESTGEVTVSGEDVASRLQEIFDTEKGAETTASDASGLRAGSETDEELPPAPTGASSGQPASRSGAAELAPMMDEEEGFPEEEEMPSQGGAGANVATVTLAEIYFQQGLREQALQIYRQLLEREPENETVRKRIGEIEATKPEGGDRDPGSDPRRPRPGLKVPKRKK
jgi:tetratricopeptide (TPR) repeat protein